MDSVLVNTGRVVADVTVIVGTFIFEGVGLKITSAALTVDDIADESRINKKITVFFICRYID
jgi:hypothetical protein